MISFQFKVHVNFIFYFRRPPAIYLPGLQPGPLLPESYVTTSLSTWTAGIYLLFYLFIYLFPRCHVMKVKFHPLACNQTHVDVALNVIGIQRTTTKKTNKSGKTIVESPYTPATDWKTWLLSHKPGGLVRQWASATCSKDSELSAGLHPFETLHCKSNLSGFVHFSSCYCYVEAN